MTAPRLDVIPVDRINSLNALLHERIRRTPDAVAYRYYDAPRAAWLDLSWRDIGTRLERWVAALAAEGIERGQRVGVMMRNCPSWVCFEQAALSLGLVLVPLYTNDRADNVLYIIQDAEIKILLLETREQWLALAPILERCPPDLRFLSIEHIDHPRARQVDAWLAAAQGVPGPRPAVQADDIATLIYTSGTTGRPKGVMLSHRNILWNASCGIGCITVYRDDIFLSFLPLSHALERTVGYYIPIMTGATVAYARSVPQLADDLIAIRPTILVSVPRIFERVYGKLQAQLAEKSPLARRLFELTIEIGWRRFLRAQKRGPWTPSELLWPVLDRLVAAKVRAKLGGRLRIAISGGAPLPPAVARVFLALGVPVYQGYGLTEASPIISVNPVGDNVPASIGVTLPGLETRVAANGELLTRSPSVMRGYWKNPQATAGVVDTEGWLHTGDLARVEDRHLFITGRLKDIIVLANGEKVPPADMEMAIALEPLFEQALVIGEGRPYLSALVVLNSTIWEELARGRGLDPDAISDGKAEEIVLERLAACLREFPGYAQIKRATLLREPWTIEKGLVTPTLKLQRRKIQELHQADIDRMYAGH